MKNLSTLEAHHVYYIELNREADFYTQLNKGVVYYMQTIKEAGFMVHSWTKETGLAKF